MEPAELRCSFCLAPIGKGTGTLGADAKICDTCVNRAADRIEAGSLSGAQTSVGSPNDEATCSFCYNTANTSALFTNRGHFVCSKCIGLICREVIGRSLSQVQDNANGVYPL